MLDLTDNELAKLHTRHMVGGHASGVSDEVVYRFEFPERPGALMTFVTSLHPNWNISIFHYRNHGSDVGRIVVGVQVPTNERTQWFDYLKGLRYEWVDESHNPVYQLFLGSVA